jgi:hypothetical protein
LDRILKRELDGESGERAGAGTSQRFHGLYTSLAHCKTRKCMERWVMIFVQKGRIPLAPGAGPRYKRRVHSAAQRGWQISGEVVVPAAQSWLDTPRTGRRKRLSYKFRRSGNFFRR